MKPSPTLPTLAEVRDALRAEASADKAEGHARFFKTGPGEYGEGDRFLGVTVPAQRAIARRFRGLPLDDALALLASPFHEERLTALFFLVDRYRRGDDRERAAVFEAYLGALARVNNWDLVDSSAEHIIGAHLEGRPRDLLYRLARSPVLWERRVAMMSTFHFIKKGSFDDALALAEALVGDGEDLIHKAVGWMLREIGARNPERARDFLDRHAATMPRTMLRYAIEKMPERERAKYLGAKAKAKA